MSEGKCEYYNTPHCELFSEDNNCIKCKENYQLEELKI